MPKGHRGFRMSRWIIAVVTTLLAATLPMVAPMEAVAQSAKHSFSGLCAFYPARGDGMTAAHKTLPFGTRVRISDSVTVTINDRGPFGKHRVLDVSPSAARALGMVSRGVILVR